MAKSNGWTTVQGPEMRTDLRLMALVSSGSAVRGLVAR
jgi:hypothetical protein